MGIARLDTFLRQHSPRSSCREADKDMVLMGFRIPKGTPLMLSPYPMQVSPYNFLQPNTFWPDRWLSETVPDADLKHSGSFLSGDLSAVVVDNTDTAVALYSYFCCYGC